VTRKLQHAFNEPPHMVVIYKV